MVGPTQLRTGASQVDRAEELLVLRSYKQAAEAARTVLRNSFYSSEQGKQQHRERAASVLVQALDGEGRGSEAISQLTKLYGSQLDIDTSALLLWVALTLQADKAAAVKVLEQQVALFIEAAGHKAPRLPDYHAAHQLVCQVYASEVLCSKPGALQGWLQAHRGHLDSGTLAAIAADQQEQPSAPQAPSHASAAADSQATGHSGVGSVSAAGTLQAARAGSSGSTPGPATPTAAEQPKPAAKAAAAGQLAPAAQAAAAVPTGVARQADAPAAARRWWDPQPEAGPAAHALPPGLPPRTPQASTSAQAGWALPLATACAGVMAYAAIHERQALSKGASRAVQAATSGIADALGAGMRVTPNPSGARAMYSRL